MTRCDETLRPRRENVEKVPNGRAVELKVVGEHIGMCNDIDHEDAQHGYFR